MSTEMRWPVAPLWKGHPHHRSRRPSGAPARRQPASSRRRAGPTLANGGRPRGRSGAVATQERAVALRRRGCA
jgi:hypothetical protein